VRDATNWIASYPLSPGTYLSTEADVSLFVMRFVSARADLLGATDILSQAALDKYAFVRDAYTQRRQYQLTGAANAALPDYGDEGGGAAAPAAGASTTAAPAKPGMGGSSSSQGLPNYADPGVAEPASAPAGK
jgi:phospholipid-binding lipoprotein MlaA